MVVHSITQLTTIYLISLTFNNKTVGIVRKFCKNIKTL